MFFFSIGLPSRFADWCDAFLTRVAAQRFGSVNSAALNGLDELATAAIRTNAAALVACCRQPVVRLQTEIIQAGHPFLLALGDPRAALRNLVGRTGFPLADATRLVASSCAAMLNLANAPNALVVTPPQAGNFAGLAASIADQFGIALEPNAALRILTELAEGGLDLADADDQSWWRQLPERDQSIINGALEPYISHFAGRDLERLIWEPELFFTSTEPPAATLVAATGPIDMTGRVRHLVYGPFINLPPGAWSVDVVLGFSPEAAGMNFLVEVFAGSQLAHTRVEVTGEQVIESRLYITIGDAVDQPLQIRVMNERAAFDGRLALGYVAMTPQAALPEAMRQRLHDVLSGGRA